MKQLVMACAVLVVAACGKKADDTGTSGDPGEKFVADFAAIKDRLCACTNKSCTDTLKAEADAHEKTGKDLKPSRAVEQKFSAVEDAVNACSRKF